MSPKLLAVAAAALAATACSTTYDAPYAGGMQTVEYDPASPGRSRASASRARTSWRWRTHGSRHAAEPAIAAAVPQRRVIIDAEYFRNESAQRINTNIIVDNLRVNLQRAAAGRIRFVSRESMDMVADERDMKRDGVTDPGTLRSRPRPSSAPTIACAAASPPPNRSSQPGPDPALQPGDLRDGRPGNQRDRLDRHVQFRARRRRRRDLQISLARRMHGALAPPFGSGCYRCGGASRLAACGTVDDTVDVPAGQMDSWLADKPERARITSTPPCSPAGSATACSTRCAPASPPSKQALTRSPPPPSTMR